MPRHHVKMRQILNIVPVIELLKEQWILIHSINESSNFQLFQINISGPKIIELARI